jgi:hypothetical protein
MELNELSKFVKYEREFKWTLDKSMVEKRLGYEITNEEFYYFAKHFENNFINQFAITLDWQSDEWEEVQSWTLPDDLDISMLL